MIRINLLPVREERKREAAIQQGVLAAVLVLGMAAVLTLVHLSVGSQLEDLRDQITRRRAEISRLQAVIGEVKEFKQKKRELEEKIDVIDKLEARQRGPSRVLHALTQIIPEKMWIERLRDSSGALSLEGIAIDNQTIARFMTAMEGSPWFKGVRLDETRQIKRGDINLKSFSIKAQVVYQQRKAG